MKVNGPLYSRDVTGKFDGGIIFENTRGLPVAKRMKRPPNPQSQSQTLTRNRLSVLSRAWGDLTQAQRDAWDAAAPGLATGYNNYVGLGIKALEMDETPVGDPPVTPNPDDILDPELRTGSLGEIDITWNPATDGDFIEIRTTGAIPDGRNPKNNEYRVIAFISVAAGTYALSDLVPAGRYGVRLRPMRNNGQAGNTWEGVGYAGDPLFVGYLPCSLNKSIMIKFDLVDFRRLRTVIYGAQDKFLAYPAMGPGGEFVYCTQEKTSPDIYKIRCNDLQIEDKFPVVIDNEPAGGSVVDSAANFMYLGNIGPPATLYKIDLNTRAVVGSIVFGVATVAIPRLLIDSGGVYLYGLTTRPGARVFKVDLNTFTLLYDKAVGPGSGPGRDVVLDEGGGFLYASGGGGNPKVFKCNISDLTQVALLDVTGLIGELVRGAGPLDGYFYFSSFTIPGEVGRFRISDFTFQGKVTGQPGEDRWQSLLLDTARKNLFTINWREQGRLVKISTLPFQRVAGLSLAANEEAIPEMAGFLS